MNRIITIVVIVAALIAGTFYFTKHHEWQTKEAVSETTLEQPPATGKAVTAAPASNPMYFESVQINTAEAPPRACLQFSEPLPDSETTHFADYLQIQPKVKVAYAVAGSQLCLSGLTYGQNYSVTIASGFPAANGDRTVGESIASITGELPENLRRFGEARTPRTVGVSYILYPPASSVVDLTKEGDGQWTPLTIAAAGGTGHLKFFINDAPVAALHEGETIWTPDGPGFATVTVVDELDHKSSSSFRLKAAD